MKTSQIILAAFLCFFSCSAFSQINYQAVLRDADNFPISDSGLEIDVTITQDGTTIYSESHSNVSSTPLGILNLAVGAGIPTSGVFNEIDWSLNEYEITVSVDEEVLPSSPIRSVPMAEFAKNSRWSWNETDSVLNFSQGRVAINTSEIGNSTFKVQGYPDWFTLSVNQGADGSDRGIILGSPNSDYSGRIYMNGTNMFIGRGSGTQAIAIRDGHRVGIGGETFPQDPLHVRGLMRVEGFGSHQKLRFYAEDEDQDNRIVSNDEDGNQMWMMIMGDRSDNNRFVLDGLTGDNTSDFTIENGQTSVKCLRILGGCDLKEDFNSVETLQAGDIVVLDENNPGQLIRSATPYDRKVAGVISGANGINPGITLSQDDLENGEYPLAMVGKVYVNAVGRVEVGDLLTTSNIPGKAMAASDYSKVPGTVIGKAMSKLEEGEGFVLVLVNLQ